MSPRRVSLAELTERHRGELVGYLARMLGDHQEAEDACQEAFVRAHRAFDRLGPDANSRAWLYRIATNTGLNATLLQAILQTPFESAMASRSRTPRFWATSSAWTR